MPSPSLSPPAREHAKAVSDAVEICEMGHDPSSPKSFLQDCHRKVFCRCHLQFKQGTYLLGAFHTPVMKIPYTTVCNRILKLKLTAISNSVISSQEASWKATGDVFYHENSPYYLFTYRIPFLRSLHRQIQHTIDYDTAKSSLPMVKGNLIYKRLLEKGTKRHGGERLVVICGSRAAAPYSLTRMHASSPYKDSPLIEIDCFHLGEKQCQKIFKDDRSIIENNCDSFQEPERSIRSLQSRFCYYFESLDLTSITRSSAPLPEIWGI